MSDLKEEIDLDPEGLGYSAMNDQDVVDAMNLANRPRNRNSMSASEILNAVVQADLVAITDADKRADFRMLMSMGELNPFGVEEDIMIGIFGTPSATITALAAARVEQISRATEIGIGKIRAGHVQEARR